MMEKINLKEILNKHQFENKTFLTSNEFHTCLNAMKEVWDLAVDKCKENMKLTNEKFEAEGGNIFELDALMQQNIDLNSLEQIKQLIE